MSLQEISVATNKFISTKNDRHSDQFEMMMSFDFDQDGQVTLPEIASIISALDTNGAMNSNPTARQNNRSTALCNVPKPAENAEVVFLSGYKGEALTTLAVSGQEKATTVGTVTIHKGDKPLYIFASASGSVVWQFKGDTERIQQLVIQAHAESGSSGAAVAGVAGDKIEFIQIGACLGGYVTKRNAKEDAKIEALANWLGRKFDHIVVDYKIVDFQVPPGVEASVVAHLERPYEKPIHFTLGGRSYQLTSKGMSLQGAPELALPKDRSGLGPMRSLLRFYPGGLLPLEPNEVYSPTKVRHYTILPEHAGILQLMAEGKVVQEQGNTYRITKPISHFPGGLSGSHSVTFILAKDIPMPAGSPGHSTVKSEETGKCLIERHCK